MESLDDIALFVQVVKYGSLASAGKHLKLPAATVTRRLQKLEQTLGIKLLHRSARKFVLTPDGEVYFQTYADLISQLEQAQQQLSDESQKLSGHLKVLAPVNLSHGLLRPMWVTFTRTYPDIELELLLSNHQMDLIENQADLAVRIGRQTDSALYQRRIGQIKTVLVASRTYIELFGDVKHPAELVDHQLIGLTMRQKWQLKNEVNGQEFNLYPRCKARVNDPVFVKHFVIDSQGIALAPLTEVESELNNGELVHILPEWVGEVRDIFVIWPGGKLLSKRAQCLRDFIYQFAEQHL